MWVIKAGGFVRLEAADFRIRSERLKRLLFLGLPMGLQNVITGLGGVVVQSVINSFGTIFVAGFTAANKLYGLLETAAVSYSYAVVSYTGQNAGAGDDQRVKKGFGTACVMGVITSAVMSIVMLTCGRRILGRSLRLAFGGCVFGYLPVVGISAAVHHMEGKIGERSGKRNPSAIWRNFGIRIAKKCNLLIKW